MGLWSAFYVDKSFDDVKIILHNTESVWKNFPDAMEGRKVYVGSLNRDSTKEDVEELFTRFGKIESVWIARNPAGFAFVVRHPIQI